MFALVEQCLGSSLSKRAFARQQQIPYQTFLYWYHKKEKASTQPSGFIPLKLQEPLPTQQEVRINYPNGVEISLSDFNINQIAQLLKLH